MAEKLTLLLLKIIQLGNVRIAARRIQLSDIEKITVEGYGYGAIFCKDCRKVIFLIERI